MDYLPFINQLCVFLLVILLTWAAITDVKKYTISNWISIALILFYIPFYLSLPVKPDLFESIGLTLIVLIIGFFIFAIKVIGAGDIKLFTAVTLWAGAANFIELLIIVSVVGGVLAITLLSIVLFRKYILKDSGMGSIGKVKLPYGVAIAAGGYNLALGFCHNCEELTRFFPVGGV